MKVRREPPLVGRAFRINRMVFLVQRVTGDSVAIVTAGGDRSVTSARTLLRAISAKTVDEVEPTWQLLQWR